MLEALKDEYIINGNTDLEKEFGFNTVEILKDRRELTAKNK